MFLASGRNRQRSYDAEHDNHEHLHQRPGRWDTPESRVRLSATPEHLLDGTLNIR
jgi:hypothetical protein